MKRLLAVDVLVASISLCAGCGGDRAKQAEAPPSVEQLKEMISRAASVSVETILAIADVKWPEDLNSRELKAIRQSPDRPLTLLILSMTFENRDVAIELPEASRPRPLPPPRNPITLSIRPDGQMTVGGETLKDDRSLRDLLARAVQADPSRRLLIHCDRKTLSDHFARVSRICNEAGLTTARIDVTGTTRPAPGGGAPVAAAPADPAPPQEEIPRPPTLPPEDFQPLDTPGTGSPADLVEVLCGRRGAGAGPLREDPTAYASVIRPEYITECSRNVQGDTITGSVSFRAEGFYQGRAEYVAGRGPDGWRVTELRLPASGRRTVLTDSGTWRAGSGPVTPARGASRSAPPDPAPR